MPPICMSCSSRPREIGEQKTCPVFSSLGHPLRLGSGVMLSSPFSPSLSCEAGDFLLYSKRKRGSTVIGLVPDISEARKTD